MDRPIMDMKKKKKKKKKVTLISSNGMPFEDLDLAMLSRCGVIKARIEKAMNEQEEEGGCSGDDEIITLRVPEITGKILAMVLEYCRISTSHVEEEEEDLKRWKAKLAAEVDDATLAHLLLAADYLDMWELLSHVGDVMGESCDKVLTPEEINEIYERKLESEEEEVSRRSLWMTEEAPVDF